MNEHKENNKRRTTKGKDLILKSIPSIKIHEMLDNISDEKEARHPQ